MQTKGKYENIELDLKKKMTLIDIRITITEMNKVNEQFNEANLVKLISSLTM